LYYQARSQGGSIEPPFCNILSLMCGQIHWMVQIEDLVNVSTIIPLVSFHYWHVIFTGGCNSSTIEPTVANPRVNRTPLRESLATCLITEVVGLWELCSKFLSSFYSKFLLKSLHYAQFYFLCFWFYHYSPFTIKLLSTF